MFAFHDRDEIGPKMTGSTSSTKSAAVSAIRRAPQLGQIARPLAAERDELLGVAPFALDAQETVFQDSRIPNNQALGRLDLQLGRRLDWRGRRAVVGPGGGTVLVTDETGAGQARAHPLE